VRRCFYPWTDIVRDISDFVRVFKGDVDYVTLVSSGEPTLDSCIGKVVEVIKKEFNVMVAVLTNSSLLWLNDVRSDLTQVDYVSIKVDVVDEGVWRSLNRPHPTLKLVDILNGIVEFSKEFKGVLTSETMLIHDVNTSVKYYEGITKFLSRLGLHKVYISIPIRPPAESYVKPPLDIEVIEAYEIFSRALSPDKVELLNIPEPLPKAYGDPITWLLNTVSVHPLRYEYVVKVLEGMSSNPDEIIEKLVKEGLIVEVEYLGSKYILKSFKHI
jgi:wyosine [tRNA(Phe)-imidazoG37] synthetase (radical SAM superfamily)